MKPLMPLVLLLSACGEPGGAAGDGGTGEGNRSGTTQTLTVNWSLAQPNGSADACPSGNPKIKVVASAVSGSNTRNGDDRTALFDCTAKTASLTLQTSGDEADERNSDGSIKRYGARSATGKYTLTLVITDASGEVEHQAMPTQDVDLTSGAKTLSFVVTPSASRLSTAWGFRNKTSQQSLQSCAAAGVAQVRVKSKRVLLPDMTPDVTAVESVETFPCGFEHQAGLANEDCTGCQGVAMSKPLLFGHYATSIEALNAANQVVGTLPFDTNDTVRVDRETLVFSRTVGGNPSRAYVGLSGRDFFKVDVD